MVLGSELLFLYVALFLKKSMNPSQRDVFVLESCWSLHNNDYFTTLVLYF